MSDDGMADGDVAQDYLAELRDRRRTQRIRANWSLGIVAAALALLAAAVLSGQADSDTGGLAAILAAFAGMAWSRFCVAAEETERAIGETEAMELPPSPEPRERHRQRQRLVHTQRSLNLARNRALSSITYAIVFIGLGLLALVYVAASLPDFLARYEALHVDEGGSLIGPTPGQAAWVEGYEAQLLGFAAAGTVLLGWGLAQLVTARNTQREAERLEVERELMRAGTTPHGTLARKLFLLNGQGLEKYYNINRLNNRLAMVLSGACILIGVGITVWTVRLVLDTDPEHGQVVIAAVGAANTVMVHVVAAIVLRMQGTIWANVDTFHRRLVRTHELFLANVIAADLDTPEARRHNQALLALAIGERDAPTPKPEG